MALGERSLITANIITLELRLYSLSASWSSASAVFMHFTDVFFLLGCTRNLGLAFNGKKISLAREDIISLTQLDHVTFDDAPGIIRRWNGNSGSSPVMLSASSYAVKVHKMRVTMLSRDLGGRIQPGRKAVVVLVLAIPTCSDRATWRAGEKHRQGQLKTAHHGGRWVCNTHWRRALIRDSFSGGNLKELSVVPEKVTSPEVTWASSICWPDSSSPEAGYLVPMCTMNQMFSDGSGSRNAMVWELSGSFVSNSPTQKKRKKNLSCSQQGSPKDQV